MYRLNFGIKLLFASSLSVLLLMLAAATGVASIATGGSVTRASTDMYGNQGDRDSYAWNGSIISSNGRYVVFQSGATNLVPGEFHPHLFRKDLQTGALDLVNGLYSSGYPSISADGRYVAYAAVSRLTETVFVKDMNSDDTIAVAAGSRPRISADGKHVGYVLGSQIYIVEIASRISEIVSADATGNPGNSPSEEFSVSADGRYVAFSSSSTNLATKATDGNRHIFVKDTLTGVVTKESEFETYGILNHPYTMEPALSADGRFVAYTDFQVKVKDRKTGKTRIASSDICGDPLGFGGRSASISADGRYVSFYAYGSGYTVTDQIYLETQRASQIYVKDMQTGVVGMVSTDALGLPGNSYSFLPSISADGSRVAFNSNATNLVSGDTNVSTDIFVADNKLNVYSCLETPRITAGSLTLALP